MIRNGCTIDVRDSVSFDQRTVVITGASRGLGRPSGVRLASAGANVAILAKTTDPHPKLPGTIYSAAEEIETAGGQAMAIPTDIRDEQQVADAIGKVVEKFGGVDILVNNASAIFLAGTLETPQSDMT